MPSQLLARGASAAIVLMTVAVVALGAPLPTAQAAEKHVSASVLAEGAGLGAAPSAAVRRVQRILDRGGFDLGPPGVDGRFGPLTATAVRRAQTRYGLVADGVVGPKTRRLLTLLARSSRTPARRSRATQPPPATTQKPQTSPATPQTTPRQPTAPVQSTPREQAPARAATTRGDSTLSIVLAALAVLLSAAALTAAMTRGHRRHDEAPLLAAIDRDLYVEGRSERAEVGAFRGLAVATAIPRDAEGDPRRVRYLVDDPRKPAPVWIEGGEIRRSPSQLAPGEPVIGYVTTDPDPVREQETFMEIEGICEQAGWKLEEIVRDRDTGRMVGRPGLMRALESIAKGDARGLIVSDARSLVRSLGDLGALLEWFRDAEAALVALDIDLDTATIHGYQTASTLIAVSGWASERTASRARQGLTRVQTPERAADRTRVVERIHAMRAAGMSLQAIADQLNNEGVPTLAGGSGWRPAAIKTVLGSPSRRSLRDELPAIPTRDRQG
jgi:DNA invertase Pin-like site-specific DNA recombinase